MSTYSEEWKDGLEHATGKDGGEYVKWNGSSWDLGYSYRYNQSADGKTLNVVLDRTVLEKELQDKLDSQNLENQRLRDTLMYKIDPDTEHKKMFGDSKKGGGVTKLYEGTHSKSGEYNDPGEAIRDLEKRSANKDWEAREQLAQLKAMATQKVISHYLREGHQLSIVECVRCHSFIDMTKGNTCARCGWIYSKEDS